MKNLKITICMTVLAIASVFSQEEENYSFLLSSESVEIYDFKASMKGAHYEYQFEDVYTVKLTNKVYKINLFFDEGQIDKIQKVVSKVLDVDTISSGFQTMVWKKTAPDGKLAYKVEVKKNKLRIEVTRKNSDSQVYNLLSQLGQEFIKSINS
ncbi:hypothetical protein FEE95_05190 [Maribacter algarum]|uniref:Uncharacterized protein n=1 Tax=Maribacter algarum (ex Zhang et al. 2020) TaxID=2578118 RepID=A0A5S3PZR8_9FLAO|nr:hypothetical protein [Maribacter algarum]TMM58827.1 hypothetical protein FEE95_05190 [Maribacter algarum]